MSKVQGDIEKDFFDENPGFRYMEPFVSLIKSKGRSKASKLCWAVWLIEDVDSPMYNAYNRKDREKMVSDNYMKEDTKWEALKPFVDSFIKVTAFSKAELLYKQLTDKFEQRTVHLTEVNYEKDWEKADKMFEKTLKIQTLLKQAEKEMLAERDEDKVRGGRSESATERGLLD